MNKFLILPLTAILFSCGGGGGSGSSGSNNGGASQQEQVQSCVIVMNTITLASGESCNLSSSDASTYSLTAGEVSCASGTLTYGGSQFSSGADGVQFNGLTFSCS